MNKVLNTIKMYKQLINTGDWKQLWLNCIKEEFKREDFQQLEYMLNAIGADYFDGKEEAAFHLLKKIVKDTINSQNCAYISTIYYRAKSLEKMGYSQKDIYNMFHEYKYELNIKDITDKLLIFN